MILDFLRDKQGEIDGVIHAWKEFCRQLDRLPESMRTELRQALVQELTKPAAKAKEIPCT